MATALLFLTYLASVLLIGIFCALISKWLKIPNTLLLLIVGIGLGHISFQGEPLIGFPPIFITSLALFGLVMVVFNASSKFKLKVVDALSLQALKVSFMFLVLNIIFLSLFTWMIFGIKSIYFVLFFATLMTGTDPSAVLTMLAKGKSKVFEFLKLESLINTPITVIFPFIILDFLRNVKGTLVLSNFIEQIFPFLKQIVTGIGAGVLIGLIIFKVMRKQYSLMLSEISIITAALLTYIIAENFEGNGILAVTTLGLFFGNVYIKERAELQEFSSIFTNSLIILVFVLVGLTISVPLTPDFLIRSFLLFLLYIVIRFFSLQIGLRKEKYGMREKIFMAFNVQKGLAVPVVVLSVAALNIAGIGIVLNIALTFLVYSIIISTIVLKIFSGKFIDVKKVE